MLAKLFYTRGIGGGWWWSESQDVGGDGGVLPEGSVEAAHWNGVTE